MHMADALLSPAVGTTMCAVSAAAIGYSVKKIKNDDLCEKKIPIMAVTGAFVFAAQMINFTIPGTGSSGHIGGGILLAGLLGSFPAFLAISVVLIIQCLFFADGGLLALGCNIFNIGLVPCLLIYPLVFKPIIKKKINVNNITIASILSVVLGLQLGAFSVVLQTQASGITELPFKTFILLMQPIHFLIGMVEGVVTASVLSFVYKMRPEILESANKKVAIKNTVSIKKVMITFAIITIFTGGGLSIFASSNPDGLEWSILKVAGTSELQNNDEILEKTEAFKEAVSVMPDYDYKNASNEDLPNASAVAGLFGGVLVFILAGGTGFLISKAKKSKKKLEASLKY